MSSTPSPLGKRVAKLRKPAGISTRELSAAIGGSHGVIFQLENGDIQSLNGDRLLPLARALGTSVEWLMTGEGKAPKSAEVRAAFDAFKAKVAA